jgi:hypothetical protein
VPLRRHERERLLVGVEDEDAGGQLHATADGRLQQRDFAGARPSLLQPVGVAASTLAAAALFSPLRSRLSAWSTAASTERATTPR